MALSKGRLNVPAVGRFDHAVQKGGTLYFEHGQSIHDDLLTLVA